jgi:hypothetical protein
MDDHTIRIALLHHEDVKYLICENTEDVLKFITTGGKVREVILDKVEEQDEDEEEEEETRLS